MRLAAIVVATLATTVVAHAQPAPPPEEAMQAWAPVPPLNDQSGIGNYCVHDNLVYSMGSVLCVGLQGVVCVPPGANTGGRAYWSSVPISRGDVNWAPPAHCGRP